MDLQVIENDLGNPTFIFNGNSYNFIPSISEFQRELDTGGYKIVKLLTASVRKFTYNTKTKVYTPIFTTIPSAQNIITYSLDGTNYRIESIKHDPTNSYFRITAASTTKGI